MALLGLSLSVPLDDWLFSWAYTGGAIANMSEDKMSNNSILVTILLPPVYKLTLPVASFLRDSGKYMGSFLSCACYNIHARMNLWVVATNV